MNSLNDPSLLDQGIELRLRRAVLSDFRWKVSRLSEWLKEFRKKEESNGTDIAHGIR